ncbi:MAG: PhoU domain-containing protein [Nitrososphaerales archaeon]
MEEKEEETRKIQFTGKSSYIVSLPKKWVEDLGLKPKDHVTLSRQGNYLLQIVPAKRHVGTKAKAAREAVVEMAKYDDPSKHIRKLIALYLLGFNVVHIRAKDGSGGRLGTAQREAIKDTVRRLLMGTEITADSTDGITIQVLINLVELSVDGALKRMVLIAKSMLKDVILALQESNLDLAKEVIKSDDEVDRFSFYIIRQLKIAIQNEYLLADMGLEKSRDCLGYRLVVKSIERIADHAARISEDFVETKESIDRQILSRIGAMSDLALEVLDDACLSLFKRDYDAAEHAIERAKRIEALEGAVFKSSHGRRKASELYRIKFITENLRRIAEYASDIAEIVLNMTVEKQTKGG